MLDGAALAGRCLLNAGMGVHHGLSQLVGGRTGIPHGLANAILLTHAVRFNADAVPDEVARIGAALGDEADAAAAVDGLRAAVGLPGPAVRGRRGRGRPRGGGAPVAVERQRGPQPAPGVRGRRPRHPPSRLVTPIA